MTEMFAQGDLLIERVADVHPSGIIVQTDPGAAAVLAEGELTGHRHAFLNQVVLFRDEGLARDIPAGLYVAHVRVENTALLSHDEHNTISLEKGTYRVRRQRELEPRDAHLVAD